MPASCTNGNWVGMNWIRQEKRLAVYLRDGLACAYCGFALEEGAQLSLDHVKCRSKGGDNGAWNLVTCCRKCNSSRQDRPMAQFARTVAAYTADRDAEQIVRHIRRTRAKDLAPFMAEAKDMVSRRGSAAKALEARNGQTPTEEN